MTSIDIEPLGPHPMKAPHIYKQNVVSTWHIGTPVCNIMSLASMFMGQYDLENFAAAIFRLNNPASTTLLFHSGNCVTAGSKSEEEAMLSAHTQAEIFLEKGIYITVNDFKIRNIVCSVYTDFTIDLQELYRNINTKFVCTYDHENFPGLTLRLVVDSCNIVLLIYSAGKLVITGPEKMSVIEIGWHYAYNKFLLPFKKDDHMMHSGPKRTVDPDLDMQDLMQVLKIASNDLNLENA